MLGWGKGLMVTWGREVNGELGTRVNVGVGQEVNGELGARG